ncbi:FAD-dependent oxidoreductase [Mariniluteicoccus flavus]
MTGQGKDAYDVVIVGAGINGLVAAAELSGAGMKVALVDEHDRPGGFIRSDELTEPGHVHDTFSSWHPLFHISPAFGALMPELARHGLDYCNTDGVLTERSGATARTRWPTGTRR